MRSKITPSAIRGEYGLIARGLDVDRVLEQPRQLGDRGVESLDVADGEHDAGGRRPRRRLRRPSRRVPASGFSTRRCTPRASELRWRSRAWNAVGTAITAASMPPSDVVDDRRAAHRCRRGAARSASLEVGVDDRRRARRRAWSAATRTWLAPMIPAPTTAIRTGSLMRQHLADASGRSARGRSSVRYGCTGSDTTSAAMRERVRHSASDHAGVGSVAVVVEDDLGVVDAAADAAFGELHRRTRRVRRRVLGDPDRELVVHVRATGSSGSAAARARRCRPGPSRSTAALRCARPLIVARDGRAAAGRRRPRGWSAGSCGRPSRTGSADACPGCAAGAGDRRSRRRWW